MPSCYEVNINLNDMFTKVADDPVRRLWWLKSQRLSLLTLAARYLRTNIFFDQE